MSADVKKNQFTRKLRDIVEKYRTRAISFIAILTIVSIISAQIIPIVDVYIRQNNILQYLCLLILFDIAISLERPKNENRSRLVNNQDESITILLESIEGAKSVDLLEYAGVTILPLLRAVERKTIGLRVLVKHPDTIDGIQRDRTIGLLDSLYNALFVDYKGYFEVRCYRLPYSLRGRFIRNKILEFGWLTPNIKGQTVFGHVNPSYMIETSDEQAGAMINFFDRTFDTYWNHEKTEDGRQVLERLRPVQITSAT